MTRDQSCLSKTGKIVEYARKFVSRAAAPIFSLDRINDLLQRNLRLIRK